MHKVGINTIYGKNFEEENFHIWSGNGNFQEACHGSMLSW